MEVVSSTQPSGNGPVSIPEPADPLAVLEHIVNLIETSLGAARRELEAIGSLLSKSKHAESLQKCAHFATDPHVAIYAQKDHLDEMVNGHEHTPSEQLPPPPTPKIRADNCN